MIYLDNAATTFPKPPSVNSEVFRCMKNYCGNPGRGSHALSAAASKKIYECREEISKLFHSEKPENVVFTYNTTYALNIAVNAFVRPGMHILTSNLDHNSVLRPVYALEKYGIAHDTFNAFLDDEKILLDISRKVRKNTGILICSHVSNVSSRRLPIKEIGVFCKRNGIVFIVDAAQSAGIYDIDISCADAVCVPSHKSLYGPQGVGFIVFSEKYNGREKFLDTLISGGGGINSLDKDMPDFFPERFEGGTLNTPGIAGLCEGIKIIKKTGLSEISEYETELGNTLRFMLKNSKDYTLYDDSVSEGGTVLFNKNGISSNRLASALDAYGICTRSGFHCSPLAHKYLCTGENGALRVSFGIFNTKKDIDVLWKTMSRGI